MAFGDFWLEKSEQVQFLITKTTHEYAILTVSNSLRRKA